MVLPFRRSLRSLRRDTHRPSIVLGVAALGLLGAWAAWAFMARIALYESSTTARLETVEPVHVVEAPIDGRVVELLVGLGDLVEEGQPLIRLEYESQRLELSEAQARQRALEAQLDPLEAELSAAEERLGIGEQGARGAVSEARARSRAALAQAEIAEDHAARLGQLAPNGVVTREEVSTASSNATRAQSEAEAATLAVQRLRWEHLVSDADVRTRIQTIRRELARVAGEAETAQAHVERLERELERRAITAPSSGRVAEIAPLSPGRYVAAGTHLLSVLPRGDLRVVASFTPGQAFGRVRSGQSARMRLDGFPWTRFGMLDATVARVADETTEDGVRVELGLEHPDAFAAPLEHGLPGRVEVEVERVSPAELLLRTAGQWLGS